MSRCVVIGALDWIWSGGKPRYNVAIENHHVLVDDCSKTDAPFHQGTEAALQSQELAAGRTRTSFAMAGPEAARSVRVASHPLLQGRRLAWPPNNPK